MDEINKIDSVDEMLVIETTVLKKLLTPYSYNDSIKKLINDIENKNEAILNKLKNLKLIQKKVLLEALYNWDYDEDYFGNLYHQIQYSFGTFTVSSGSKRSISRVEFHRILQNIFSENLLKEVVYRRKIKWFDIKVKFDGNKIYVTIFRWKHSNYPFDIVVKGIFKYNKEENIVKLCYVENQTLDNYETEVFFPINKILYFFTNDESETPKIRYNKKYSKVVKNAIEKKYLNEQQMA